MLSLRTALTQTHTTSVRGLRATLGSERTSLKELFSINLIHQHYLGLDGIRGRMGLPTGPVQFAGGLATRDYRAGQVRLLADGVHELGHHEAAVRFIGFRCVKEADSDQGTPQDEPYFIISVDQGNGTLPKVKKFAFENVNSGTEIGVGELLIERVAPNALALRVAAFENDQGNPDDTAKKIQDEIVKLSQQAASLASAASAADGAGEFAAGAGTVGGIAGGPLGAIVAAGIVLALDLGDDFIGQSVAVLFPRPENVGTPPTKGQFQGTDFNQKIDITSEKEGQYELFFDVHTKFVPPSETQ